MKDLPRRVVTALLFGAIMLGSLLFGRELGWALVISLGAGLALGEFYAITRRSHRLPNEVFGMAAVLAMPVATALYGEVGLNATLTVLVVASLLWHLAFRQVTLSDTAVTVFGAVFVGYTLSHLVLIRLLDAGTILTLATLVSVWVNDMAAYFVGSTVGRRKMSPRVSPNKTWEGFFAGSAASVAAWVGVYYLTDTPVGLGWHVAIGLVLALATVAGDLVESRIKREVGVKDSGRLLPGHGGFLDRFDALILASVAAYYLLVWAGVNG
ncbi:MAG: phosphatidate cytidylyltransferase [Coriobacteriia bacterium]